MLLDRNKNPDGKGKYALIKLRETQIPFGSDGVCAMVPLDFIDYGSTPDTEFFVIHLKDKYAGSALRAYALAARADENHEYADEIFALAARADEHPNKQTPD